MSEQKNTYEARVRKTAELLHATWWKHDKDGIPHFGTVITTPEIWDQARAMVAEMARCYEDAYFRNYDGIEDSEDYVLWNENCISEMQERGLIPSPENIKP
jgi:hypothetical protein